MISDKPQPQVAPFPTKLVGGAVLSTLAVFVWLSWFVYDAYQFIQDTNNRIVGLERARGDIVHLDEVLTMSASMAAATGEIAWIDRYRSFEPKLDSVIKRAIEISRQPDFADAIRETGAANIELVKMENQAFTLIRERRLEDARAILFGEPYLVQKQVYAGGMEKLMRVLRAEREATVESQRTATIGSILAVVAVAAVIIVTWLIVLGRVREWRAAMSKTLADLVRAEEALRKSHDDLERRVMDRTRELQDEIAERKQAEEELAAKEAQLRVALDNMPGGMLLRDRDLNHVLFNSQYSELYELPDGLLEVGGSIRNELRYQADRGDFGPGDKDELIEEVVATYQRGEVVGYERAIAGSGRTLQLRSVPTPEGGYVTFATDITDRKRAEDELQAVYGIIKDQKERMEDELNIGRGIQMSMIPLIFPPFPDYDEFSIFAALEPAREVGGDFYDFFLIDEGRLCFCVGDVSGKGVPSALFMAVTKTLIKSRAIDDSSTASILTHVNAELSADIKTSMFVTVFLGILNFRSGEFVYTNAGHNPPYLKRKGGSLQRLDARHGPMIGVVPGMVYREETDTMTPGDILFMYTDGVTEERNADRELFSEKRLVSVLASTTVDSVENAVRDTVAAVKAFQGDSDQEDDITVLAVQFQGRSKHDRVAVFHIMARNDLREIAKVNQEFQKFAEEHGIPVDVGRRISILLDDLLSNVISYAFPDDEAHEIEIRIELATNRLTVTISDDGIPFNPLGAGTPDTSLPLDKRALGGLGIHLIRNLVDDMSYHRRVERNVLTLVIHIE